jgi:hypothetical protein
VDVGDQLLRIGLLVACAVRAIRRGRVDGRFVVEAVEIATGGFEVFDPLLGLFEDDGKANESASLANRGLRVMIGEQKKFKKGKDFKCDKRLRLNSN